MKKDDTNRRDFLKLASNTAAAAAAISAFPPSIQRALAIQAASKTGTIQDVKHIVILMQENRSFDHYFGALRGVRGFGDRFPIPQESGKSVWWQSDGQTEVTPFHIDMKNVNAALVPDVPHNYPDMQGAWGQGKLTNWAKWKTPVSMGYYKRPEAPFQWALADAFTLCDNYFCSLQSATDPNRIVFWSGSNFDPKRREAGLNSDMSNAEVVNLRCWITGTSPDPGYTFYGSALPWKCIPEVLEEAGVSWRIYQDANDNWTGAMNGALAFEGIRNAPRGSNIYKNALSTWTLADLKQHALDGTLPAVSWICPSKDQSEHPGAPSSPGSGGALTQEILDALTASPETWSQTAFFITFDENDGRFDHVPPPAIPSYNRDGTLAGKSTVDLKGMYHDAGDNPPYRDILFERFGAPPSFSTYPFNHKDDDITGNIRPWGMGPRVPTYVISPWSRGGWVCSQVYDHTSIGMFIEARFGVKVPAISPWSRAVSGDLTAAFDFKTPNRENFPQLPDMGNYLDIEAAAKKMPKAAPPATPAALFQEAGVRPSRALPYALHVHAAPVKENDVFALSFENIGTAGAVFHVYDAKHLDRIPRRYTVEAGKTLVDTWSLASDEGAYDLSVYGPNGFLRSFKGNTRGGAAPMVEAAYDAKAGSLKLTIKNADNKAIDLEALDNAYGAGGPWTLSVPAKKNTERSWSFQKSERWYDITIKYAGFERRFAGRIENGLPSTSDPVLGIAI